MKLRIVLIIILMVLSSLLLPLGVQLSRAQSPSVTFAVIGDYGMDDAHEQEVANLVNGWSASFIITTGDDFYNAAIDAGDTGNKFHESTGKFYCAFLKDVAGAGNCPIGTAAQNAFFPSMGNHDYTDATPAPSTYTNYFTLPGTGITSSTGNERYYDFVQGPVHFFVVNSNSQEPDGTSSSSVQAQWLQTQLAASTSPWNLVYFHHPPYSSGSHGSNAFMQWPFAQLPGSNHDPETDSNGTVITVAKPN